MTSNSGIYRAIIVLFIASIAYLLAVFSYLAPPVVALEVMNDLGLNPSNMSLMFAATFMAYALMQPMSGFWADRFGPRKCLVLATLLLGLGSLIFSQVESLGPGVAARIMVGVAAGLTLMPCMKLATAWFRPAHVAMATSAIIAISAVGNGLTGRPLAIISSELGWQATFMLVGLAGMVWAVLIFAVLRDRPKISPTGVVQTDQPPVSFSFFDTALVIIKIPSFWLLGLLYMGTDLIYCTFTALWIGPYLMQVYSLPEVTVGNMISLAAVGYFIGPPILAWWGGAWSYAKVILTVSMINVGLVIFFVTSPDLSGNGLLYFICFLSPIGAQLTAMLLLLARDMVPDHLGGSAMGFLNVFPIMGGAIMQKIVGSLLTVGDSSGAAVDIRELYGYAFTPMLIYVIFTVFLAIWLLHREKSIQSNAI